MLEKHIAFQHTRNTEKSSAFLVQRNFYGIFGTRNARHFFVSQKSSIFKDPKDFLVFQN